MPILTVIALHTVHICVVNCVNHGNSETATKAPYGKGQDVTFFCLQL